MVPSSQQQNRGRKKEVEEHDVFVRLVLKPLHMFLRPTNDAQKDSEIVGCITDIGVPYTIADLQKPNPVQTQVIFEWFAELLMNATRETVDPAMRAAAEDVCGDYVDIIPADTRNLMGFYISLQRLLAECHITDFSFQDLFKPTHERLTKIFSSIINFVRFRESQSAIVDEYFNKAETTKDRIEHLYVQNQEMEARLESLKRDRKAMEIHVAEKVKRNDDAKNRLMELKKSQENVVRQSEDLKAKKAEITAILGSQAATIETHRQESAKLKPYVSQSPAALQAALADLTNTLNSEKAQIETNERRARGLQTSTDTFSIVTTDVASCIKLIEDISVELARAEEEKAKNSKQVEVHADRSNNIREIERTEGLLQRQLSKWLERTEKLRDGSKEKATIAKEKMEDLRATHRQLTEERNEKEKEIETRRVRIEQTEKKVCVLLAMLVGHALTGFQMADLKEKTEDEIHRSHEELVKLDAHMQLYIKEMEHDLMI